MPIKFLYSLFCLLTGVLSAMSSRAAGPGVINLLPSDYRAANKNWAVAEDDAGTLYAGNDKGLLEFDGLQWRLSELLSAIPAFRTAISGKSTSRRRGCCFNRSTASTFMITSASAA